MDWLFFLLFIFMKKLFPFCIHANYKMFRKKTLNWYFITFIFYIHTTHILARHFAYRNLTYSLFLLFSLWSLLFWVFFFVKFVFVPTTYTTVYLHVNVCTYVFERKRNTLFLKSEKLPKEKRFLKFNQTFKEIIEKVKILFHPMISLVEWP